MTAINNLLNNIYIQGWSNTLYNSTGLIGFVVQFCVLLYCRKKYNIRFMKIAAVFLVTFASYFLLNPGVAWAISGFKVWGPANFVRIYVYLPLVIWGMSKLVKEKTSLVLDCMAITIPMYHAMVRIGCIFTGCCYGYPCSWGIWNPRFGYSVYPIQLMETMVLILIVLLLIRYAQKRNWQTKGRVYPIMLMHVGVARFILEFFWDNEKLFWGISELALSALFAAIVGAVWYFILIRKEKKLPEGKE